MSKILIVDDAEFLRVRISKMLSGEGYEICEAENGVRAVEMYKQLRPDMVLMDITMPEMDGLTALKEIRAYDPQAKVVMLTALARNWLYWKRLSPVHAILWLNHLIVQRVLTSIKKLLG